MQFVVLFSHKQIKVTECLLQADLCELSDEDKAKYFEGITLSKQFTKGCVVDADDQAFAIHEATKELWALEGDDQ